MLSTLLIAPDRSISRSSSRGDDIAESSERMDLPTCSDLPSAPSAPDKNVVLCLRGGGYPMAPALDSPFHGMSCVCSWCLTPQQRRALEERSRGLPPNAAVTDEETEETNAVVQDGERGETEDVVMEEEGQYPSDDDPMWCEDEGSDYWDELHDSEYFEEDDEDYSDDFQIIRPAPRRQFPAPGSLLGGSGAASVEREELEEREEDVGTGRLADDRSEMQVEEAPRMRGG